MRKVSYFASRLREGWPRPREIEHYFLGPPAKRWFFETDNDTAGFDIEGVDGTEGLEPYEDRIDIWLELWGHPTLGVALVWTKMGVGTWSSVGDMDKLGKWVRTVHGDRMPVALYIPFEHAWKAVKQFLEQDGAFPTRIQWIANEHLPLDAFPASGWPARRNDQHPAHP